MVTDMRSQLGRTASDLVESDPLVAVVLAEISVDRFAGAMRAAPDRVINVGIMEQTLVGVGAGFAMEGFHTIVHAMAPFLVERPEGGYAAGVVIAGLTRLRGIGPDGWKKGVSRLFEESVPQSQALS